MVRLEGEVIKNASDFSSSHMTTEKILTSEAQLSNNEILLKLQAVKVSNLYVVRQQRPLFKIENEYNDPQFLEGRQPTMAEIKKEREVK